MRYALGPLRQSGGRKVAEIDDPLPPGTGVTAEGHVVGRIELTHGGSVVAARGELHVVICMTCDRCLVEYRYPLDLAVDEECALEQVDLPEAALEAAGKAGQIPLLNEDDLDLSELVRQVVAMNLPTRSLCRSDCAGLCARCGQDLNTGPCRCREDESDPRWAGLRGLKL
jgi:uncharacterized protein